MQKYISVQNGTMYKNIQKENIKEKRFKHFNYVFFKIKYSFSDYMSGTI